MNVMQEFLKKISASSGLSNLNYFNLSQVYDNSLAKVIYFGLQINYLSKVFEFRVLLKFLFKMWNNLELEQWVSDSFENLTMAHAYDINMRYGNMNQSKLVSGI